MGQNARGSDKPYRADVRRNIKLEEEMSASRKFIHKGDEYEVRSADFDGRTHVRAFKGGQPANGYVYVVDATTQSDAKKAGRDLVDDLFDTAQSDIENGVWEKYVIAAHNHFELQVDCHPSGRRTLKERPVGGTWQDGPGALFGNADRSAFYQAVCARVSELLAQGKQVVSLRDTSPS